MDSRKILILLSVIVLVFGVIGCQKKEVVPDTPNAKVPAVMLDGVLYRWTSTEMAQTPSESEYAGTIKSEVPIDEWPTEHEQTNASIVGNAYVKLPEGIGIPWDGKWWILEPADD